MSEEQLKAFLQAVKADAGLQEELKMAHDNDAVVAIVQEAGFALPFTLMDQLATELSDEELESISGGLTPAPFFVVTILGATAIAGGGGVIALTVSSNDCGPGGGKGPAAPAAY